MSAYLEVKFFDGESIEVDMSNVNLYLKAKDIKQLWHEIRIERFVTIDIDDDCFNELAITYHDVYNEMKSRNIKKLRVYVSAIVDALGPRQDLYKNNATFSSIHVNSRIERILLKYYINDEWYESVDDTVFIHHVNRALTNAHKNRKTLSKLNINIESITLKER